MKYAKKTHFSDNHQMGLSFNESLRGNPKSCIDTTAVEFRLLPYGEMKQLTSNSVHPGAFDIFSHASYIKFELRNANKQSPSGFSKL